MEFIGIHWNPLESIGIHWTSLEFIGIHWNPLEFNGIHSGARSAPENLRFWAPAILGNSKNLEIPIRRAERAGKFCDFGVAEYLETKNPLENEKRRKGKVKMEKRVKVKMESHLDSVLLKDKIRGNQSSRHWY